MREGNLGKGRGWGLGVGAWQNIREDEAVAVHHLAGPNLERPREHRAAVGERMELAALAAWIDRGGQVVEQRRIEVTTGKCLAEHARIDARQTRTQTACDHLTRQRRRVDAEQREDRRQPGAGEALFAVSPDVFEE